MSYYDDASLVLIPSGTKTSKVYSQKPTDGSGDLTFSRASTATRTNASGVVESVASNVPRLDYSGGATCPRLLLEGQRTNAVTNSENISGSNWTNIDSTDSINVTATLDPSGYYGADKLQETTANALHFISFQSGLMTSANTYTFSCFLKAAERNWGVVYLYNGGSSFAAFFNLATGVKGTVTSGATSAIESYGNGWYRCSVTLTVAGAINANGGVITATADGTVSYAGTAGSGIYVWGAQLEAGAFASSYIPTTTAAVTRLTDVYQRNDIYTNGLISAAGGTWVTELKNNVPYLRDNANQIFIGDGTNFFTSNNFLCIGALLGTSRLIIFTKIAGVFILRHATTTDSVKIAFKWDGITLDIFVNGVKTNSAIAFSVVALNNFMSQGPSNNLFIQQMLLFPTPLTDAQCIELTTL